MKFIILVSLTFIQSVQNSTMCKHTVRLHLHFTVRLEIAEYNNNDKNNNRNNLSA